MVGFGGVPKTIPSFIIIPTQFITENGRKDLTYEKIPNLQIRDRACSKNNQ
jgi:hypothetical protein